MRIHILLIIFAIFLESCDKTEESAAPGTSGLLGHWQGIIKTLNGGQEVVTDINLKLDSDKSFTLTKVRTRDKALGTYDDFPQLKSLTLRVEQSDVQELALAGAIMDFEYELYAGELLLNSQNSTVRLKRPEGEIEDALPPLWTCYQDKFQ